MVYFALMLDSMHQQHSDTVSLKLLLTRSNDTHSTAIFSVPPALGLNDEKINQQVSSSKCCVSAGNGRFLNIFFFFFEHLDGYLANTYLNQNVSHNILNALGGFGSYNIRSFLTSLLPLQSLHVVYLNFTVSNCIYLTE